jgi:hypothetical protein
LIFFTLFLTILPVRAFVRPRQKVSRGHFVSILCSTAFCALNHGLNFVGNSAYTFQRERLTHNLQNIFSFWQKSCKKIIFELIFTSRIAWVLTYLIKSVWFTYWKSVPFFCKICIIRRKRIYFHFCLHFLRPYFLRFKLSVNLFIILWEDFPPIFFKNQFFLLFEL